MAPPSAVLAHVPHPRHQHGLLLVPDVVVLPLFRVEGAARLAQARQHHGVLAVDLVDLELLGRPDRLLAGLALAAEARPRLCIHITS